MAWIGFAFGCTGFILFHRFRHAVDRHIPRFAASALQRIRNALEPAPTPDENLILTGRLISSLQAGLSLDAALEEARSEVPQGSALWIRLSLLLENASPKDLLGSFLSTALKTGVPVLSSLQNMEKALRARRKLARKAIAISANCRAQAEVLSWLPWVMAGAIALVDHEWFLAATKSSLSWLLWALAVLICGFGRGWIRRSVTHTLQPRGEMERLEEEVLPDFVLRVISEISQGIDVESARDLALEENPCPSLLRAFRDNGAGSPKIQRLRSTLLHAARTGAPVREELSAFLQDLQTDVETRWEERIQRLPIALLGPLFICFLPSSMLVLTGLLVPIFRDIL